MWRELTSLAHATGTTPNDALVRLASERLQERERALVLQQRADERWRAFVESDRAAGPSAEALSEDELIELSRAFREDS
jgi:hypothetical protein